MRRLPLGIAIYKVYIGHYVVEIANKEAQWSHYPA
jgi:hypothetical protein